MKKALGLAVLMLFAVSTAAMAQMGGTGHDFTGTTWSGGDVCAPCHTPHATLATDAPLWNHELSISTFTPYTNTATMDATTGQPDGSSAACLGCHDGATAMDAFNGLETVADGLTSLMTDNPAYGPNDNKSALVGIDLTNDHPVSIDYAEAIANGELWLNPVGDPGVAALLRGGLVQCSSCHEPHNQGADGAYAFLRVDNTNSAMCTTCHNKL